MLHRTRGGFPLVGSDQWNEHDAAAGPTLGGLFEQLELPPPDVGQGLSGSDLGGALDQAGNALAFLRCDLAVENRAEERLDRPLAVLAAQRRQDASLAERRDPVHHDLECGGIAGDGEVDTAARDRPRLVHHHLLDREGDPVSRAGAARPPTVALDESAGDRILASLLRNYRRRGIPSDVLTGWTRVEAAG